MAKIEAEELHDPIASAIVYALTSPNVEDSNLEPANLVDVFDRIARSLAQISYGTQNDISTIEAHGKYVVEAAEKIGIDFSGVERSLDRIADAIHALAKAMETRSDA
jgi:hypothetical protein